jgi:prevent-host-death family protein
MADPLPKIPAAEVQRHFGLYQDKALTQPIAITRNGRPRTVLISIEEYERLKRRDRQVFLSEDIPEDLADAIASAQPPEASRQFDHEVE